MNKIKFVIETDHSEAPDDMLGAFADLAELGFNDGIRVALDNPEINPYILTLILAAKLGSLANAMAKIAMSVEEEDKAIDATDVIDNLRLVIAEAMAIQYKITGVIHNDNSEINPTNPETGQESQ